MIHLQLSATGPGSDAVSHLPLSAPAVGIAAICLTAAAREDLRSHRLPDRLVFGAMFAAALPVVVSTACTALRRTSPPWHQAIDVVLGGLGASLPLLVVHLRRGIGLGDVKCGAALGMAGGLLDIRLGVVSVGVAAGAAGLVGLVAGIRRMALGPWLVGAWLAVVGACVGFARCAVEVVSP